MSPTLKDSTIFNHLSIFNFYVREFCNTQLKEESERAKPFDIMLVFAWLLSPELPINIRYWMCCSIILWSFTFYLIVCVDICRLPLNVVLLSMFLDATLGIEWNQKATYAQFFSE